MSNPPGWVRDSKHSQPHAKVGSGTMAGIAAGVVTEGQVNSQPRQPTKMNMKLQKPATWTYIWVGAAFLYLVFTYFGIMSIRRLAS